MQVGRGDRARTRVADGFIKAADTECARNTCPRWRTPFPNPPASSLSDVPVSPDEAAAALRSEGYAVEWDYHDGPYGSWFIEIEHIPTLHLAFDGRDGRVTLGWETERVLGGVRQWEPLWIEKSATDLTTQTAVQLVRSATEYAKAVRDSTG